MSDQQKYMSPVCRGCWTLGNNCGTCERCIETKPKSPAPSPMPPRVWANRYRDRPDEIFWSERECGHPELRIAYVPEAIEKAAENIAWKARAQAFLEAASFMGKFFGDAIPTANGIHAEFLRRRNESLARSTNTPALPAGDPHDQTS